MSKININKYWVTAAQKAELELNNDEKRILSGITKDRQYKWSKPYAYYQSLGGIQYPFISFCLGGPVNRSQECIDVVISQLHDALSLSNSNVLVLRSIRCNVQDVVIEHYSKLALGKYCIINIRLTSLDGDIERLKTECQLYKEQGAIVSTLE